MNPRVAPPFAVETRSDVRMPSVAAGTRTSRTERLKIWELPPSCHCVTIGTCLTLADLRRTATRLGLFHRVERMNDYELHGAYVHAMDDRNRASVAVQKLLESRYEGIVRRAMRCSAEADMERLWEEAVAEAMIPGAFWALLTHPALPQALEKRIFGEVHMMSHLCGASHRGDARAIAVVERQRSAIARRAAIAEATHRETLAVRDAEIDRLRRLVTALEPHLHRARALEDSLAAARSGAEVEALNRRLDEAELIARRRETEIAGLKAEAEDLRRALRRAEQRAETLADRLLAAAPAPAACEAACPLNLAGRCIAYIGGRPQTVARIRAFVERCNGCLLAHDGGLEQSAEVLDGILVQADLVVVPLDCVSHNAMEKARDVCTTRRTPFAPLPSSSFSAFTRAIERLAAATP